MRSAYQAATAAASTVPSALTTTVSDSQQHRKSTELALQDPEQAAFIWRRIGRKYARRRGMNPDDAEDCASEFVLLEYHRFRTNQDNTVTVSAPESLIALQHRADQHAHNFQRVLARHYQRKGILADQIDEDGNREPGEIADEGDAQQPLLRKEVRKVIATALADIADEPRALFVAHAIDSRRLVELAAERKRSTEGVKKCLKGVRGRLREIMARRGWSEADLRAGAMSRSLAQRMRGPA